MSWLVLLRPVREAMAFEPTEDESRVIGEHYEHLQALRLAGKLVVAGPSPVPGDPIGIEILDVEDEDEVRAIVDGDPAVASGLMTAEIRPFRISVR